MVLEAPGNVIGFYDSTWVRQLREQVNSNPKLTVTSFLVFPSSFQASTNLTLSPNTITIVAVVLLALGYSLSVALWFMCTTWLFQLDALFM